MLKWRREEGAAAERAEWRRAVEGGWRTRTNIEVLSSELTPAGIRMWEPQSGCLHLDEP